MQAYRGTTVLQSSDIVINSLPSASNHFIVTQPCTSYGPIPRRRSARRARLDPEVPPKCQTVLDPICKRSQNLHDSLRVSRGPRKNRISNYYHVHPRPLDIPKLHYGLPDDFGEFIWPPIIPDFADILMFAQFLIQRRLLRKGQVAIWSPMTLLPSYLSTARLALPWRRGSEFWRSSGRV
jgi:hypothetical protein